MADSVLSYAGGAAMALFVSAAVIRFAQYRLLRNRVPSPPA